MNQTKNVANDRQVLKQFTGVRLDARDYKILAAMLMNLESFIRDADRKPKGGTPTFTISFNLQTELTQREKNIEDLEELIAEAWQDDDERTAQTLTRILETMKGIA